MIEEKPIVSSEIINHPSSIVNSKEIRCLKEEL